MSDDLARVILDSLAERDEAASVCPVNRPSWSGGAKPCPLCGASKRETCHRLAGADHAFVNAARAALTAAMGGE